MTLPRHQGAQIQKGVRNRFVPVGKELTPLTGLPDVELCHQLRLLVANLTLPVPSGAARVRSSPEPSLGLVLLRPC